MRTRAGTSAVGISPRSAARRTIVAISVNLAVMVGAFRDLEPPQIPDASSTTRIMQQLGGAFGSATLAVILQRQLVGHPANTHSFGWAIAFTVIAAVPALFLPSAR